MSRVVAVPAPRMKKSAGFSHGATCPPLPKTWRAASAGDRGLTVGNVGHDEKDGQNGPGKLADVRRVVPGETARIGIDLRFADVDLDASSEQTSMRALGVESTGRTRRRGLAWDR